MKSQHFHRQFNRCKVLLAILSLAFLSCAVSSPAAAQSVTLNTHSFFAASYLLFIKQDTALTLKARALREGGYETAGGTPVNFSRWYSPSAPDVHAAWITQIDHNFGLIWGFSTGESAEKYTIAPSLRLGFTYQVEPKKNNLFSLTANAVIGGELREKSCTADYGGIGGVQQVNCRLAATPLTPEETLNYLEYAKPESSARLTYTYVF
jgi:hypothetical protein